MYLGNLYIGEIKGIVRVKSANGPALAIRRLKLSCLKQIDYKKYQDIFDGNIYGVSFMEAKDGYVEASTLVRYLDIYPQHKFKTKNKIKNELSKR